MNVVGLAASLATTRPPVVFGDHAELVLEWGLLALVVSRRTPRLARWTWRTLPASFAAWGDA